MYTIKGKISETTFAYIYCDKVIRKYMHIPNFATDFS